MGIFSRFNDIVNANILHMLDKAEDPEKMVRLMIQEMEDTLVEVKTTAAKIIAEQKHLERRSEAASKEEAAWQEKAELAVRKDRDDLARGALAEKAKRQVLKQELGVQLQQSQVTLAALRGDIAALEEKLRDTKVRQKSIVMRKHAASSQFSIQRRLDSMQTGRVVAKFEQYERDLDRLEGMVGAYKMSPQRAPLEEEFERLHHDSEIEGELQAIKEKVSTSRVKK